MSSLGRILYWSQHRAFGSAERYIFDLASAMSDAGYDIHLVCPEDPVMSDYYRLEKHGVTIHRHHPQMFEQNALTVMPYWINFLRKVGPAIIHLNDPCLIGGIAAQLAGIAHRIMMHHTPELHRRYNFKGRIIKFIAFRTYTKVIFSNQLSMVTGLSQDSIRESKATVIPFGLHEHWFTPIDDTDIANKRTVLSLKDTHIAILCPARLSAQKRHDLLIQAAKRVIHHTPNAVFLFAGEGELRPQIESMIAESGLSDHIQMLGHRSDMKSLITASDVVVLTSDFEGFPYVLMEAAACGIPTIATDVGGVRESIKDGKTGLVVPAGNSQAMADAIISLITNPERLRLFGRAARFHAEQSFTKRTMIRKTAALYQALIDNKDIENGI